MAASRQTDARSAPVYPRADAAMASTSTQAARGVEAHLTRRMAARAAASGGGTSISLSSLPGRRSAGSRACGRDVVATTRARWRGGVRSGPLPFPPPSMLASTSSRLAVLLPPPLPPLLLSSPCMSVSNCATSRASWPPPPASRRGQSVSTSSRSSNTGGEPARAAAASAASNLSRRFCSLSPAKAPTTSDADTVCTSAPHSSAIARHTADLPTPDPPHSSTPRGQRTPSACAAASCSRGHSSSSRSEAHTASRPATTLSARGPRAGRGALLSSTVTEVAGVTRKYSVAGGLPAALGDAAGGAAAPAAETSATTN
mmetsp:Transcript_5349/g.21054  ORF Transcript_5349/g.21054 Transcript_5349/m.21054 type:complete len:315 (+) Transcript_5349:1039-1983(+)